MTGRYPHRREEGSGTAVPVIPLWFQHLGAGSGFEFARVDRHCEHHIVADRAGELQQLVIAEACLHSLEGGIVDAVFADELQREIDDLGVLRWDATSVLLPDGCDRRLRHALAAGAASLGAPHVDGIEFAGRRHGCEDAHAHVKRALEAYERPQMGYAAGELRRVEEHREGTLQRPPAADDRVDDRVVLGGYLVLAGNGCWS